MDCPHCGGVTRTTTSTTDLLGIGCQTTYTACLDCQWEQWEEVLYVTTRPRISNRHKGRGAVDTQKPPATLPGVRRNLGSRRT